MKCRQKFMNNGAGLMFLGQMVLELRRSVGGEVVCVCVLGGGVYIPFSYIST